MPIAIVAILYCGWKLYKHFTDPRNNVPGPTWAKYSRIWLLREYISGKHHLENIALHDRFATSPKCVREMKY